MDLHITAFLLFKFTFFLCTNASFYSPHARLTFLGRIFRIFFCFENKEKNFTHFLFFIRLKYEIKTFYSFLGTFFLFGAEKDNDTIMNLYNLSSKDLLLTFFMDVPLNRVLLN